jgi:hypothetical protein
MPELQRFDADMSGAQPERTDILAASTLSATPRHFRDVAG